MQLIWEKNQRDTFLFSLCWFPKLLAGKPSIYLLSFAALHSKWQNVLKGVIQSSLDILKNNATSTAFKTFVLQKHNQLNKLTEEHKEETWAMKHWVCIHRCYKVKKANMQQSRLLEQSTANGLLAVGLWHNLC